MTSGDRVSPCLITVAIIAVLTAIAIPVFTKQLERSRESVDFSNMRSAYAEVMAAAIIDDTGSPLMTADGKFQAEITLKQKQEGWQTADIESRQIGSVPYGAWDSKMPAIGGTATVTFDPDSAEVLIDWDGSGSGSGGGSESDSGSDSEGGSGNIPVLHGASRDISNEAFCNPGVVLQDQSGTYVLKYSGTYPMWQQYHDLGKTAAELAQLYPESIVKVNASNIKDSSSETLQAGDLCYDSAQNKFYYVDKVSLHEIRPNGSWVPLLQ